MQTGILSGVGTKNDFQRRGFAKVLLKVTRTLKDLFWPFSAQCFCSCFTSVGETCLPCSLYCFPQRAVHTAEFTWRSHIQNKTCKDCFHSGHSRKHLFWVFLPGWTIKCLSEYTTGVCSSTTTDRNKVRAKPDCFVADASELRINECLQGWNNKLSKQYLCAFWEVDSPLREGFNKEENSGCLISLLNSKIKFRTCFFISVEKTYCKKKPFQI